jgi:hypothetical protein
MMQVHDPAAVSAYLMVSTARDCMQTRCIEETSSLHAHAQIRAQQVPRFRLRTYESAAYCDVRGIKPQQMHRPPMPPVRNTPSPTTATGTSSISQPRVPPHLVQTLQTPYHHRQQAPETQKLAVPAQHSSTTGACLRHPHHILLTKPPAYAEHVWKTHDHIRCCLIQA